jgi:uncharacterized membrane protein YjgN (DUF898 family)
MAHGKFEFKGSGFGYIWLFIWTTFLTIITFGIFFPWAITATQRWLAANTRIDGKQLCFKGSGAGFFANWLLILILTFLTLGIYAPWGVVRLFRWIVGNTYFADTGDVEYLVDATKVETKNNCQNCGGKLPSDALFCEQCGNKVKR